MKILVTGAAGFVGSNICHGLLRSNNDIFGIDDLSFGNSENIPRVIVRWNFIRGDFNNCSAEFLNTFDVLIHCATSNIIYAQEHEIETFRNNAINTIKLFQRFKGKIIYTSTASVYNNASEIPTPETAELHTQNAYDSSKLIAELFLQERKNYTTLRLSNVYGANQRPDSPYCGVIGKLVHAGVTGGRMKINGSGQDTRDYTFVDDVVDAIVKAVDLPAQNTEFNIATQVETSVLDLTGMVCTQTKAPAHKIKFFEKTRKIDTITRRCLDISKAKVVLGWKPKTYLEEGIRKTISWQTNEYLLHTVTSQLPVNTGSSSPIQS